MPALIYNKVDATPLILRACAYQNPQKLQALQGLGFPSRILNLSLQPLSQDVGGPSIQGETHLVPVATSTPSDHRREVIKGFIVMTTDFT